MHLCAAHVGGLKTFGDHGPRPLGVGAWLTPRNMVLSVCVTTPNLVILYQTFERKLLWRSARKMPFKVTQGHWNRHGSIGYSCLPVSVQ